MILQERRLECRKTIDDLSVGLYLADVGMNCAPCLVIVGRFGTVGIDIDGDGGITRNWKRFTSETCGGSTTPVRNIRKVTIASIETQEVEEC